MVDETMHKDDLLQMDGDRLTRVDRECSHEEDVTQSKYTVEERNALNDAIRDITAHYAK